MNYVAHNPNWPICPDCGREFDEVFGSVIHVGLDVWCAKKRIEIENAERALEAAAESHPDPEAFIAATIIASIPKARALLGDRTFFGEEPITSSERDNRELEHVR